MAYTGVYERTIFYNPVNKYSVISVKTSDRSIPEKARSAYRHRDNMIHFAAVGYELPRTDQVSMILDGEWKEGKNGVQLHVTQCEEVVPQTREGIKGYLSSRLIKGIGGKTAELIVDRFGADTLNVLENEPERLLEIRGVSKAKLEEIIASYNESRALRDLMLLLAPFQITPTTATKIYDHFGAHSVDILRDNPFELCQVSGFGFKRVDAIMRKNNWPLNSPMRIRGAVFAALESAKGDGGHLYLEAEQLHKEAMSLLNSMIPVPQMRVKSDDLDAVIDDINGPIFGLISLDMGNYTIPDNAIWTRDAFMDVILNHVYLSDGFDTDMVAMLMQSIAPYANDEVYGERVRAKLEEGVSIIITRMNADYSFKAWGAVNSETAAQVICALSAMGIDCHTDPRFSDGQGKSVIQNWVDSFVNPSGYFHHTTSVINNAMATYQGCYASQWYLNFLEAGGTGHPYSLYNRRFDFARQLSTDASITGFEIEGKQGIITEGGEGGENTIVVTVPNGMPLTNLTPTVTMAEGATLLAPSLPVTFVEGIKQPFTVMAEDGKTTKTYNVTVIHGDVGASGAELDVNSIKLQNSVLNVTDILERKAEKASDGATEILLTVGPGVDTSKMYLSASISYAATSDPSLDGKDAMNFSDWQTFTVTSGDETVKNVYRIKVVSKAQAEITSFRVQAAGEWYNGVIDNTKSTITVTGVDDSKLTSTKLVTDIEFTGRSCSPTSGIAVDFANAATFTLGGDNDLASRIYTVTVLNKSGQPISAKSSGGDDDTPSTSTAKITGFSVLGVEGEIDQSAGTITVKLPVGTNVTAVAPVVTVPAGAVVSPVSGEVVNLSNPLTYTVTLGTESRNYTVTVIFERSISQQLWDKVAENSDVADHQTSYGHHFK